MLRLLTAALGTSATCGDCECRSAYEAKVHSAGVAEGPGLTLSRPQGSQLTKAGSIKQFGKVRNMKRDARAFFIRFLLALLWTRRCSLCLGLSPVDPSDFA